MTALAAAIPLPKLVQDPADLVGALDAAQPEERVNWMRGLGFGQLRALYELSAGSKIAADDFAPKDGTVLIGEGKNGLPLFSRFQKRFARVGEQIVGYNHNPWFVSLFVGHGHFVLRDSPDVPGEVWVDYTQVPKGQHPAFPTVHDNNKLFPYLTYGDMIDIVRRVSRDVVIGTSTKPSGKWGLNAGQYFALSLPRHQ